MRVLFVCARNRLQSPTAEQVFSGVSGIEAESAGIAHDADQPLSADLIEWAEVIMVMEPKHRAQMTRAFGSRLRGKRVVCLNISDDYGYMDPALIELLWERVPRSIPMLAAIRPNGTVQQGECRFPDLGVPADGGA